MNIEITYDAPSWTKVDEISEELRGLDATLKSKHGSLGIVLVICLRCLSDDIERKSFSRFYTKDSMLVMDICMNENKFVELKKDKDGQRKIVGPEFFEFFRKNITKYEKKILGLNSEQLIEDVQTWCKENKWISD
ncbi:hypothetical protein [Burkholderia anthina]|uniref:hypothetical protein n=1 Tax=Burkholderia anthina TaxID=179879 RepID=UPI00158ACDDD|nr:hypothetical protein [Burkholderia anthina]